MKIQYTHDTETGKTSVIIADAAWGCNDAGKDGSKLLVFGAEDDKFDFIIPLGPPPAKNISAALVKPPATEIVEASVSDIAAVRNGKAPHGR